MLGHRALRALAAAQWPIIFVDANGAFERDTGRMQNVDINSASMAADRSGLSARPPAGRSPDVCVGHQPKLARLCSASPTPTPVPAWEPWPVSSPAPDPSSYPDYARVRHVAEARGASPGKAAAVAARVVGREQVDAFLRGIDPGVEYGLHTCEWQSNDCPLPPVYVSPKPQIDPTLQHVWYLLCRTTAATLLDEPAVQTVRVQWGPTAVGMAATYHPGMHTITMGTAYRYERAEALAATLAHDLAHAASAHDLAHAASGIPDGVQLRRVPAL